MDDYEETLIRLATLRHQFERQLIRVRSTPKSGCTCSTEGSARYRDNLQTKKECDLCGPFVVGYNRARTELDRLIARSLMHAGFSPEAKADEFIARYRTDCVESMGSNKELFTNV